MITVKKINTHAYWAECDKCGGWSDSGVKEVSLKTCKVECKCRVKVNKK